MQVLLTLVALSTALIGQVAAQDAVPVIDNPVGVVYKATLPKEPFFKQAAIVGNVDGYVSATANSDGKGVEFSVKLSNLPKEGGPFIYHIHVDPVGVDGNCTKTLAHLDPFERGEATPCDASNPISCQVGDLSGKHGSIQSDPFETTYIDLYASTKQGIGAFFGNRSIVVHYANKTRLTCANFVLEESNTTPPANVTYTPPPVSTPTSSGSSEAYPSASGDTEQPPSSTPSSTISPIPSQANAKMLPVSLLLTSFFALLATL